MPKKTLDTIVETKNNYVVAVKKNAKGLYPRIDEAVARLSDRKSYVKTFEINRGRKETRIIHVFESTERIKEYLPHIQTVARVVRIRENKGKTSAKTVFYATNLELTARQFYKGIRGHWSIENKLHWVKDVVMNEDNSCQKHKPLALVFSIFRSIAISIAYLNSKSVINFQRAFAFNIALMRLLLE